MTLTLDKPYDLLALTSELKKLVPTLEGLSERQDSTGMVADIRRMSGDFTPAEMALLNAGWAAHALANTSAFKQQQARQQTPSTLTLLERVTRLETILGVA